MLGKFFVQFSGFPPAAEVDLAFCHRQFDLWDDGVAPELALDFDCPNISSREALLTTVGVFSGFALLYQVLKFTCPENPALSHETDCVIPDYSRRFDPEYSRHEKSE